MTIYHRNSLIPHVSLRRRNAQSISIPLEPGEGDAIYTASLRIGTNPNPFRIIADTGSTDFWVYSSTCPTRVRGDKNSVNILPGPGSDTASLRYENRVTLTAGIIREFVNFGGQFVDMQFACATEVSANIDPQEGVMGFALASASSTGLPPVVDLLAESGLIPKRVTGWKLSRGIDGINDGELVLGGVNPTKFVAQSKVTVNNLDTFHWRAPVDAAIIGNARVIDSPRVAILDTGALYISMSSQDAAALHAFIPNAILTSTGHYVIPCNSQAVLSLSIGGTLWPIDPRDLVHVPLPREARLPGYCISSIQSARERQPGEWLVGTAFLKNVYMILDSKANTIGLARLR
ncbi:acid protease [Dentipellis sp. KUC8613]|nr:acid protease [Dentipellis sp. KUC8613]